jgi:hypothetical protein
MRWENYGLHSGIPTQEKWQGRQEVQHQENYGELKVMNAQP